MVRTMTFSSLYAGMRTATRGLNWRGVTVLALAEAIDDGEDSDDDETRAHQHVANEEDARQ